MCQLRTEACKRKQQTKQHAAHKPQASYTSILINLKKPVPKEPAHLARWTASEWLHIAGHGHLLVCQHAH
jgi:hypothetical protein